MAIQFSALAFYAGHLCLAINQELNGELAQSISDRTLRLHWGGNAAKLINWIGLGRFDDEGIAAEFLNEIFREVICDQGIKDQAIGFGGKGIRVGQVLSPRFKDETSEGALYSANDGNENSRISGQSQNQKIIIPGEKILTVDGKVIEPYEKVLQEDLVTNDGTKNSIRIDEKKIDLAQFKMFIECINSVGIGNGLFEAGHKILLKDEDYEAIETMIGNKLSEIKRLAPGEFSLQPIFIYAVEVLLTSGLSDKIR
ncbi:MAG: hypothetical protein LRY55_11980 [Leadbetterella sp.]|nr:hypothetical protein [Leadbetterella sp.]